MAHPRNKKMTIWISEDNYNFWSDLSWKNRQSMSLFVGDQLMMVRRKIEEQMRRDQQAQNQNQPISSPQKRPSLQPRYGNDGNRGGLNNVK